jgi:hypothetical protein
MLSISSSSGSEGVMQYDNDSEMQFQTVCCRIKVDSNDKRTA